MIETDKDTAYDPDKEQAQVVACLIHPAMTAITKYRVKEINGFEVVDYGLCAWCVHKFKHDPTYAKHIDKKLSERLDKLHEEIKLKREKENGNS